MLDLEGLSALKEENKEEGAVKMCKAFDEWRAELLQEGRDVGMSEGLTAGRIEGWESGRREGMEVGRIEGEFLTKIKLVRINLMKNVPTKMLADFMGEKPENIELIRESIHAHPDMNDEGIWGLIKEQ